MQKQRQRRREGPGPTLAGPSQLSCPDPRVAVLLRSDFSYGRLVELGYARVSTAKQDLERQVDALTTAGIAAELVYLDKKSGATTDRPGLRAALAYARATGFYGLQFVSTQMWRSSWSGPRGYSAWVSSHTTSAAVLGPIYWNVYCNNGKGYYDYYPVVQGYASRLGWGPTVRTSNDFHYDCGPSA